MAKPGCGAGKPARKIAVVTILIVTTTWSCRAVGGQAATAIALHELKRVGTTTRVQTELKAKGLYRPGLPPGGTSGDTRMPKPLTAEIDTRFIFHERFVEVDNNRTPRAAKVDQLNTAGCCQPDRNGSGPEGGTACG